jgi:hypothetical protein
LAGGHPDYPLGRNLDYTRRVRRLTVLALVALASVSCGAAIRWEKPGVSDTERKKDETECVSLSSREGTVPSAQTATSITSTPVGYQTTRVDPYNATVFDECMGTRGYKRVPSRPPD